MPARVREEVAKLKHKDLITRWSAVDALGDIGHSSALPHLAKALNDEDIDVRWSAAEALFKVWRKDEESSRKSLPKLAPVFEQFRDNEEPSVIVRAIQAAHAGKVKPKNAALFIKQLRAMQGRLK